MKKTCIIGTGNRFYYFIPIFDYLLKENYIKIEGISNKSNNFKKEIKKYTNNTFNNYELMIDKIKPDLVIILTSNEINIQILKKIYKKVKYICVETPLVNINDELLKSFNNYNIHVLENWFYLPLEIIKKQILDSKILGDLILAINKNRTFKYHGISQLRNYINFDKNIIFNKNKTAKYKNLELIHYEPKINDSILSKIVLYFKEYKIISDCLIKDNQINLNIYKNNELISIMDYTFNNKKLEYIKLIIKINNVNHEFEWKNEFNINIDENQYGSLKSILKFLKKNIKYSPKEHNKDMI